MDAERREKIKASIEDTNNLIENIEIIIQGLKDVKAKADRLDERAEIQKLISSKEKEVDFLCDLRENDESALSFL